MNTKLKFLVYNHFNFEEIYLLLESLGGRDRRWKVLSSYGSIEILKLNKLRNYEIVIYEKEPAKWTRIHEDMSRYMTEEIDKASRIINDINSNWSKKNL